MKIGRLRHRVTLQQSSTAVDDSGQPLDETDDANWSVVGNAKNIPARVDMPTGKEGTRGNQVDATRDTRVTLRYRTGVEAHMRFVYGDRKLYIRSAVDPDGLGRELVCICGEQQ